MGKGKFDTGIIFFLPCNGLASHPGLGGVDLAQVAQGYRNQNKLQLYGPLGLVADSTYLSLITYCHQK